MDWFLYDRYLFLEKVKEGLALLGQREALVSKCSSKKVFFRIFQISQEKICVGVSFY